MGAAAGNVTSSPDPNADNGIDNNPYAGLVNKNFAANYVAGGRYSGVAGLNEIFGAAPSVFDQAAEPLMIYNKDANKSVRLSRFLLGFDFVRFV